MPGNWVDLVRALTDIRASALMASTVVNQSAAIPASIKIKPDRPWWLVLVESSGVLIWAAFMVSYARRIHSGPSLHPVLLIPAVFLGILLSDFWSGLLHWFFDTFLEVTTPIIGGHLVGPFREHHHDPLAMTRHSVLEQVGNSCIAFLPYFLVVWRVAPVTPQTEYGVFWYWVQLAFGFFLTLSNVLHSWAHDSNAPRLARRLQQWGLIVSPEHHAPHHVWPHRSTYCVTTGWVNGFADRVRLFTYFERVFVFLGVPKTASIESKEGFR